MPALFSLASFAKFRWLESLQKLNLPETASMLHGLGLCFTLLSSLPAPTAFPAGVLDADGRTAFVSTSTGIDAVDLASGERLWQSSEAHVPLLVAEDRLYALTLHPRNLLSVVAFDLQQPQRRVFRTDVTDLPRWISTRETETQSFHFDWSRQDNELFLDWQAEARSDLGPAKRADGQVRIDLESGRVQHAPLLVRPPQSPDRLPISLEKKAIRWYGRAGGQLSAVVLEDLPESTIRKRRQRLVFRAWDARTGKESTPRELLRGERLMVLTDLDGKYVWLRDAGGLDELHAPSPWRIVSVLDGHYVGQAPFVPGTQMVTRIGQRAYVLTTGPARTSLENGLRRVHHLRAVDLERGTVDWSYELGDHSGQRSRTR